MPQQYLSGSLVVALAVVLAAPVGCSSMPAPPPRGPAASEAVPPVSQSPLAADRAARRQKLADLLTEQWEYHLRQNPEFASVLGDRRYNDRWSDSSPRAIEEDLAQTRSFLTRFEAIDTSGFHEQETLSHQLMVRELRLQLEEARFESWLMPVNQMTGVHLQLAQLVPLLPFATVADYESYLERLRKLPAVLEQNVELMRLGQQKKLMPPGFLLARCVAQAEDLANDTPEKSPFAGPLQRFPASVAGPDQERLRAAGLAAIRDQVLPAYARFTAYLRDQYAPQGRSDVGVWSLPDGEARYRAALKRQTTTAMSPEEIHEVGLREVSRIELEQEAIGRTLGFPELRAFRKHVRASKKLYAKSEKDILDRYQRFTEQMQAQLPRLFSRLPMQRMIILPVEKFREKSAAGAEYHQGTKDGTRPGIVRVNTFEPSKRLTVDMESTAFHEGLPGHHLQIAIQQELPELPPFRQQGHYGAYQEGWALYSERLGKEVGFFQDPYSDYGRLQDEMLRAIRLVVDTGLHFKKWNREQVVKFFHDHSTIDEPSVQSETDRYIAWPAQACAYKIGQLTIMRLRQQAQTQIGNDFDLREFHDQILGSGPLPLDVLEARLLRWTAAAVRKG